MTFKNNYRGYFGFYYKLTGKRLFVSLFLSIGVSTLDGLSLAMFMPLLEAAGNSSITNGKKTLGNLHYIIDFIEWMGLSLNIPSILSILVVLFVLKGLLRFLQLSFQVNTRHIFMTKVRKMLMERLVSLSYKGFLKLDAGKIHNTLTGEVSKLFQSMNNFFNATQNAIMLSTYILLAFLANFQFAILVAVGAGLSNLIYRRIYVICKRIALELSKKGHNFNSYLIQCIHNFKYLKSTNYLGRFSQKINTIIDETEYLNKKISIYNAITTSVKEPLIIIVVVLVIFIQINITGVNISTILLSLLLFYRSLTFLLALQNEWQSFIQFSSGMVTVSSILAEMESMKEEKAANSFNTIHKNICLKNLSFSYGNNLVLNNININIQKNKTIALVGESGSGKTTLANIISGLILPDEGKLEIDGIPLSTYNIETYRNRIGYISQEPVIFNDNIYNNITFWAEPTKENIERFWHILELASLKDYIEGLENKEQTELGDNGMLISGGQKQRVSIARELYKKTEVLILDEATSALDSETEKVIQKNIENLHGTHTIIIIAHRLSTIKNADVIFLLEKGNIVASGNFEEMLSISDRFKRMVALQEM